MNLSADLVSAIPWRVVSGGHASTVLRPHVARERIRVVKAFLLLTVGLGLADVSVAPTAVQPWFAVVDP